MRYIVIARDGTDPEAKARRLAVRPEDLPVSLVGLEHSRPWIRRLLRRIRDTALSRLYGPDDGDEASP